MILIKLRTYKIFSTLLLYPTEELKEYIFVVEDILRKESILDSCYIEKLMTFCKYIESTDLILLQECYVSLFDRQRHLSLYLFEHIHGDSRDRGMAMVDLKNLYRASDFDILSGYELPDYIPVFLEYLSILSVDKAAVLLGEIINIIAIVGNRLLEKNSMYNVIFFALESLSNIKSDENIVKKALLDKRLDQSVDKSWEDIKVF